MVETSTRVRFCPACFEPFLGLTRAEAREHLRSECPVPHSEEHELPTGYTICTECEAAVETQRVRCHRCGASLGESQDGEEVGRAIPA